MINILGKDYTIEELHVLRDLIEKAINGLNDTDAVTGTTLFPLWTDLLAEGYVFTTDDVTNGFRCQYNGVLYKVLQAHTIQESWNPIDSPSLFTKVLIPDENVIPEWVQPDSTNGYSIGDKVTHNGVTYESLVDNNVWEPGATGTESLWSVVE